MNSHICISTPLYRQRKCGIEHEIIHLFIQYLSMLREWSIKEVIRKDANSNQLLPFLSLFPSLFISLFSNGIRLIVRSYVLFAIIASVTSLLPSDYRRYFDKHCQRFSHRHNYLSRTLVVIALVSTCYVSGFEKLSLRLDIVTVVQVLIVSNMK